METSINATDQSILALLQKDDEQAMERIFDTYYSYLVTTAYHVLTDEHQAKDLVQDVLFHFWTKRDSLTIESGLKSYLRRSVVNRAIDQIRRKKRFGVAEEFTDFNQADNSVSKQELMETSDLESAIMVAINSLPERCKLIFSLSRFENMSHAEISEQLDISKKTIENQMTKALKVVRQAVSKYKSLSIWVVTSLIKYF